MGEGSSFFFFFFLSFWIVFVSCQTSDEEKEALESIYNSTSGEHWYKNTNWLLGDPCLSSWFGVICDPFSVISINLVENNLVGTLPPQISNFSNLLLLDLNTNIIFGEIPPQIGSLSSLETLDLSDTLLDKIPSEIGLLSSLKQLALSDSFFFNLPTEVGLLSELQTLDLSSNLIQGSIPIELSGLTQLRSLKIGSNLLIDGIPSEFGRLTRLRDLRMGNNIFLGGTLPTELGQLSELLILDFRGSQITGSIPTEYGQLKKLNRLLGFRNFLEGTIPTEINLPLLFSLDLGFNYFSGTIPSDFGTGNLSVLLLAGNLLEGEIPSSLGDLSLNQFSANSNRLAGTVPSFVCDIEFRNLNSNFFSCPIPDCCSYEGDRSCIACYNFDEQNKLTPSPSPLPSPSETVTPSPIPPGSLIGIPEGVKNSSWVEKRFYALGKPFIAFQYETNLDTEAYVIESFACPQGRCVFGFAQTQSCNYSDIYTCVDESIRCGEDPADFCEGDWTTLTNGKGVYIQNQFGSSFRHFRFYFDRQQCSFVSIRVMPLTGDPDLYVSTKGEVSFDQYQFRERQVGGDQLVICPTDRNARTYFIGVFAYEAVTSYEIIIESQTLPSFPPPPLAPPIGNFIRDGIEEVAFIDPYSLQAELIFNYIPDFENNCFVHIEANGNCRLSVTERNISDIPTTYYGTLTRYTGRSYIDLSYCGSSEYAQLVRQDLFFDLKIQGVGYIEILATTRAIFRTVALGDLLAADSTSRLIVGGGMSYQINGCDDCFKDALIWSGNYDNLLDPPLFLQPETRNFLIWDRTPLAYNDTIFTFYLVSSSLSIHESEVNGTYDLFGSFDHEAVAGGPNLLLTVGRAIVRSDGNPLVDTPSDSFLSQPELVYCDADEFEDLVMEMEEHLAIQFPFQNSNSSFDHVLDDLVLLDMYRYSNPWSFCERQMYAYFGEDKKEIPYYVPSEVLCELFPNFFVCTSDTCAASSLKVDFETYFVGNKTSAIDELCNYQPCDTLYLTDFGVTTNFLRSGLCQSLAESGDDLLEELDAAERWYSHCKELVYAYSVNKQGRPCVSQQDCQIHSVCNQTSGLCTILGGLCLTDQDCQVISECDFFRGVCTTNQEVSENMFLNCVINSLPVQVEGAIAYELGILSQPGTADYFTSFKGNFSSPTCVNKYGSGMASLPLRDHYVLDVFDVPNPFGSNFNDYPCYDVTNGFFDYCLDILCVFPPECQYSVYNSYSNLLTEQASTLKSDGGFFLKRESPAKELECEAQFECNWISCSSLEGPACKTCLSPSTSFPSSSLTRDESSACLVCSDVIPCVEVLGITSIGDCEASFCITPFQSILPTKGSLSVAETDCENVGYCTGWCDTPNGEEVCISGTELSGSACLALDTTRISCDEWGGNYFVNGTCVFPTLNSREQCQQYGFIFESCSDLSAEECKCYSSDRSCRASGTDLLHCYLSNRTRCSKESCVEPQGECSDSILNNDDVSPPRFASCVVPFAIGERNTLFCPPHSIVTQLGCILREYDEESCDLIGGSFVSSSRTKEGCDAHGFGCRVFETSSTGILVQTTFRECQKCGGIWEPFFDWKDAQWVGGNLKNGHWEPRQLIYTNELKLAVDFIKLGNFVLLPKVQQVLDSLSREAYCTSSLRTINAIGVIGCDCNPLTYDGTWDQPTSIIPIYNITEESATNTKSGCAYVSNASLILDQNLCPDLALTIVSSSYILNFSETSLGSWTYCVQIFLSFLSADDYTEPIFTPISLSFTETQKLESTYQVVKNRKDYVVGQLIGDGLNFVVEFPWLPPPLVECESLCFVIRQDIEQLDIYTVYDLGVINKQGVITPLGLSNSSLLSTELFALVCYPEVTFPSSVVELFPILRLSSWFSAGGLSTGAISIFYITAAFYTLAFFFLLFLMSGVPWSLLKQGMLVNLVICLHCIPLYLSRAVYFYLLGSEVLPGEDEDIADYVLIEIPTFFFLGMFGLLTLSFLVVYLRGFKDKNISDEMFWTSYILISAVVWISFVLIVVAFAQFEQKKEGERTCYGRIVAQIDSGTSEQRDGRLLRIIYKSCIALVCLVVVVGLAYLNWKIRTKSGLYFQVSCASLGLFFNSVAFVIYYALDRSTPYFSIVLWFTELGPTLVLCLLISPRRIFRANAKRNSVHPVHSD